MRKHLIGASALWTATPMLQFVVRIRSVRTYFGRPQVRINPEEGIGAQWVDMDSLSEVTPSR